MPESAAPWPKDGLAGQVSSAARHAPEGATDREIITVALTAYREGRDIADVWQEVNVDG